MKFVASYRLLIPTVKNLPLIGCLLILLTWSPLLQAQTAEIDSVLEEISAPPVEEENNGPNGKINLSDPLEFRAVPDSTVHRFQKDDDFAYANDPEYWAGEREQEIKRKREQEKRDREKRIRLQETQGYKKGFWDYFNDFFSGSAIRNITYIALITFFLFVIYRLIVVNKLFLFYSAKKAKAEVGGEAVDIKDDNLDERIKNAVDARQLRLAVRFMYLKTLQLLNDKQWIRYHADATNYEYVNQMSKHKLGTEFGFLTRIYDYVWYGEFTLTDEQFEIVYKNFSHFYNALPS